MSHKVLLVNTEVGRGDLSHPVCGASGKTYGRSHYDGKHGGAVFEMTAEEYKEAAWDLRKSASPRQRWIPMFVEAPEARPLTEQEATELAELPVPELTEIMVELAKHAKDEDNSPTETILRIVKERDEAERNLSGAQKEIAEKYEGMSQEEPAPDTAEQTPLPPVTLSSQQEDRFAELSCNTVAQLKVLAEGLGIEISKGAQKAQIIAAIMEKQK